MATEWQGKSKGTVLGYRIFIFLLKKLGIGAAYSLLGFVALYYCFFSPTSTREVYKYFRERRGRSVGKAMVNVYRNYYVFGQTLIDRVAISSGLRHRFTYDFDGIGQIKALLKKGQGGILISAHVGNFEIADHFFDDIDQDSQIYLVTTDAEHAKIKQYLESVTVQASIQFILVQDDLGHIFEIKDALDKGKLVCFTGDRFFSGQKTMETEFLGETANFPAGPFLLSARLGVPVLFVYVMKEPNRHYHLFAREAQFAHRKPQQLLESYVKSVTWILDQYPLQWFNYYDFWKERK
ncbi:MAG: lipid A biosynthesis acyltransferase [Flavobacteriaceae bacterium]